MVTNIQDRTAEFRAVLAQAKRKQRAKGERENLLTERQRLNGSPSGEGGARKRGARSEFAKRAADIGRGITGTTEKLHRLALLARKRTMFDDRPVEIAEITYVRKIIEKNPIKCSCNFRHRLSNKISLP